MRRAIELRSMFFSASDSMAGAPLELEHLLLKRANDMTKAVSEFLLDSAKHAHVLDQAFVTMVVDWAEEFANVAKSFTDDGIAIVRDETFSTTAMRVQAVRELHEKALAVPQLTFNALLAECRRRTGE
jgi:hypothetical protein